MVSIQKFRMFVLVSNPIEYWGNYSIQSEISNIRTSLHYTSKTLLTLSTSWPKRVTQLLFCQPISLSPSRYVQWRIQDLSKRGEGRTMASSWWGVFLYIFMQKVAKS